MYKRLGFLLVVNILVLLLVLPVTGFLSLTSINLVFDTSINVDYKNSWLLGFLYFQVAIALKVSNEVLNT